MTRDSSVTRSVWHFALIWGGQIVSLTGSRMTIFALGVWVFQSTGSATQFALLTFAATLPGTFVAPLAGVVVDRWDRRSVMILSDSVAGLTTIVLILLVWFDQLEVWHLYGIIAINEMFNSLQQPAFSASIPLLIPKRHLARVAGLSQAGVAVVRIATPFTAGMLLPIIELKGILTIDLVTFFVAVATLLTARIPRPPTTEAGSAGRGSILKEAMAGWSYLRERTGLFALLFFSTGVNFASAAMYVLVTPLVLSFGSAEELGLVMSIGAGGLLTGSILMSVWGGPKKRIEGFLYFLTLQACVLFLGGVRPSIALIAAAAFCYMFFMPLIIGCSTVIWQSKVAPDVMGRVFATQQLAANASRSLAYIVAGPLADFVFEPWMAADGPLAPTVGAVIGTGPGRGIGLLYVLLALLLLTILAFGFRNRALRNLEEDLPDAIGEDP